MRILLALAVALPLAAGTARADEQPAEEWLPNLFFNAQDSATDFDVDLTTLPGRWLYRFRTSLPNIGLGPLVLEATGTDAGDGRQTVLQHVYRADGSFYTRPAGNFRYNPANERMEAEGWSDFHIRQVLPDDGVGPIVARGGKTVVRITSSARFTTAIPNVPPASQSIQAVGGSHGISVGYTDIYTKTLDQQWIDFTGVCGGEYWLEIVLNRHRHILESNYGNNVTRFKFTLPHLAEDGAPCRDGAAAAHSADRDRRGAIDLSDLLRVIQLFNSSEFSCAPGGQSEDGYQVGDGPRDCAPHDADYNAQDWRINLSELLRVVQFFNAGGYFQCLEVLTEDGFCPFP